jgi:hypothetical protein
MKRQTGKSIVTSAILLMLVTFSSAAFSLIVSVDRTRISEADQLRLNIKVNEALTGQLEFDFLTKDFEILRVAGPNQNTKMSIINGKSSREVSTSWDLILRAKRLGRVTIPRIQINSSISDAIVIEVIPQTAEMKSKTNELVFVDTSVDTSEAYVQGQIIYTIKLHYVDVITGEIPAEPKIENAIIETIENEKRYETYVNNRRYFVYEKRFAIFPQRSGVLEIPRVTFTGSKVGRGFFSNREPIMAFSETHTVTVKPKPNGFTGEHWLPAKAVNITETWSSESRQLTVGEPINRNITITVHGQAATLLPIIDAIDIQGAKSYKDPEVQNQTITDAGIVATSKTTVGIVPTQSGKLILPAWELAWWNTVTDKMEIASLPAQEFSVIASSQPLTVERSLEPSQPNQTLISESALARQTAVEGPNYWQLLSGVIMIVWFITLFLLFKARRRPAQAPIEETPTQTSSETELFNKLQEACQKNHAANARNLLFLWGKARLPNIDSTRDLALHYASDELLSEIEKLEASLYSPTHPKDWLGAGLRDITQVLSATKQDKKSPHALMSTMNP